MLDLFNTNQNEHNINQFEREFGELKSISENYQNLLESLKESETKYRFLTENSADIVWHLDKNMRFTYVSPADERVRGYKQEEVLGKHLDEFLTQEGINLAQESLKRRLNKLIPIDQPVRVEIQVKCKNGEYIWTEVNVNPIIGADGKIDGYNGITRDIRERKKFEEEIQRKTNELKESNETKDKFFSIIAHDLRSPFQGLLGVSNLLATEAESLSIAEIKNFALLLNESLTNQFKLLEDLLNWSRIQSGKMKYEPLIVRVREEVENVLQMFQSNAVNKNITINNNVEVDCIVYADRDMYWLLMRNLVSNAIKFTNKGGKIEINSTEDVDYILVEINDNGVGIENHNMKKLFRIDGHFSTEGTDRESGTGLGLILCKEIVERHHCQIWVESEFGKGSSFKFTMPKINHS